MKKTLLATATGVLLIACGGIRTPAPSIQPPPAVAPGGQAVTALERACLSDPMDAAKWEALAAALDADGQRERARTMYEQAATLRAHDVRRDYALLREKAADLPAPAPAPSSAMPRTEVRQLGAALVEVLRVAPAAKIDSTETATAMPVPMPGKPANPTAAMPVMPAPVRLEISNGNGINGAAARLARSLSVEGVKTVRLTNMKNFDVPISRIEYQREQQVMAESLSERLGLPLKAQNEKSPRADMRIVLGHDATLGGRFK
ncbi:LytR C-terminal domain-containing protein [Oxalobacteraceae bacterium OTU3CAMAD1]|nr:LytR C-terminal domain-containing protein [Oxalobacteraceae bacterium OTU3CAMAD1]